MFNYTNILTALKNHFPVKGPIIIAAFLLLNSSLYAQVGISNTSITPHVSSILELRSTTAGFLPPRLTTAERDAVVTPATGLLVYNSTTSQLNYYNGTAWQPISGTGGITSLNGLTSAAQTFVNGTNQTITSTGTTHTLGWTGQLSVANGGTGLGTFGGTNRLLYTTTTDNLSSIATANDGVLVTGATGIPSVSATLPLAVQGNITTLANNAVTYAKMQPMTANKLLGSGLTGTAVSEITLGTGLSFTGTTLNASSSGGSVTSVSVANANGFSGTVANATTTPAITLTTPISGILKGNGTAISAAAAGDFPVLNQNTSGSAATVTTNANLTGPVTSVGNATTITNNVVANSKLAQVATQTFKGRTTAGTGDVEDLTATQATAMLNSFTSTTKGLVPASGGGTSTFLRADGSFAAPPGGNYRTLVTLGADVTNSNATANTIADVTGLSFDVTAGVTYRFEALIAFTSAAVTTGSRWAINGPATPTLLSYTSSYPTAATGQTNNYASAYNIPALSNASSLTIGNIAMITGIIKPSASGTVIITFASEIASSAITAKAGSTLEWW